jgi:hypothetical protein
MLKNVLPTFEPTIEDIQKAAKKAAIKLMNFKTL